MNLHTKDYIRAKIASCNKKIKTLDNSVDRSYYRGMKAGFEKMLAFLEKEKEIFVESDRLEFTKSN